MTPSWDCCPCRRNLCFGLCKLREGEEAIPPYLTLDKAGLLTSGGAGINKKAVRFFQCCFVLSGKSGAAPSTDFAPFPPRLCGSYPQEIIVPAWITDKELESVASFRSWKRIPAVVYR